MKKTLCVLFVFGLCLAAGCQDKTHFTVAFEQAKPLRYKFVTERHITFDWGKQAEGGAMKTDTSTESAEIVMAYEPVAVSPAGITTLKATCESVKASSTKGGKDALESIAGKSFTLQVNSAGKIKDYNDLKRFMQEAGEKAVRSRAKDDRIKEPDLTDDFVATQWFLWDAYSSVEKPAGVDVGNSWKSHLSIPNPMVIRIARGVTYTFDRIEASDKSSLAVIKSVYSIPDSDKIDWPSQYTGKMRISGKFGTLRNYKLVELTGSGEEFYNITKQRSEKYQQQYKAKFSADFMMPLEGITPEVTLDQKISMELLEN